MLLSPGRGKTTIIYCILKILLQKRLIEKTLVIAPLRVCYNVWPRQAQAWQEFADLKIGIVHGKGKDDVFWNDNYDIYCINPEGLDWLADDPQRVARLKAHFTVLVVDESTKFKSVSTKRFKLLKKLVKWFKRRYILTGTIVPNGLLDLFGQIYILDEGAALGSFITHFKSKYFYPVDFMGYTLAPHPWAMEAITKKIAPLTLVLTGKEGLDLPELFPCHDILVDLPPDARKVYKDMSRTMIANVENGLVVAANAAVVSSKCRQVANGGLYSSEKPGEWTNVHDAKLDALEDLVDELSGESLLVVYEFGFDLEKMQKRFPKMRLLTTGNVRKDDEEAQHFANGLTKLACGQFTAISLGIDGLQNSCHHVCMFGVPWDLQAYIQTIDRVHRSGQKYDVTIHRILANDTLDMRVISVLENKTATQEDFLTALKEAED